MFKDDYQAAFSKVAASGETRRRILNMTQETKKQRHAGGWGGKLLLAAVLVSLLTVTASAAVKNWFIPYFEDKTQQPLSQEQVEFVEEHTQNFGACVTQNGWTIELRSAITDGSKGYILLGITAPENVDLGDIPEKAKQEYYGPGNDFLIKDPNVVLDCSAYEVQGVLGSITTSWQEDGDGKNNTLIYVIDVTPDLEQAQGAPFDAGTQWRIHIKNLVHGFPDQTVLAEGVWDFEFAFDKTADTIEVLDHPMQVRAYAMLPNGTEEERQVTVNAVTLSAFGVKVSYGADADGIDYDRTSVDFTYCASGQSPWYAVMRAGTKMRMVTASSDPVNRVCTLGTDGPMALENVAYLLTAEETRIPVPEQ